MIYLLRRLLSFIALAALLAVPLNGCAQAVKTTQAAGLDDSIAKLASGGVAVMDDFASTAPVVALTGPPSAMRFTRWQVQNLVAEANGHAGYVGSELDTLATPPAGVPPLSILIGAWLTRNDGALANYAHGFMGDQDYKQSASIVFPTIVVLAFIADIARVTRTAQAWLPAIAFERLIATPAEADGVCTSIAGWVSGVVNSVTSAVQANGSSWLASLWNTAVSLVGAAISVAINGITQSLLGFITKVAAICGTLMQVASLFKPWSVQLAANPSTINLGADAQPGAFDATLNAKDIPWPPDLVGCVAAISSNHIDLTDASYKDAPVTWTQPVNIPGLATKQAEDDKLLDDKTAHYTYTTTTVDVPAADDCPREVNAGKIGVTVTVERSDITKTLTSLESLITGLLNSSIQSYLQPYISPALDAVTSTANKFAAPHESAIVTLKEQVADPLCQHTPPPNGTVLPSPTAQASVAGTGILPALTCDQIITASDTTPYLSGAANMPAVNAKLKLTQMTEAMAKMAAQQSGNVAPSGYDATRASVCMIGLGSGNDAKEAAQFTVVPRGPVPYVNPDIHKDPVDATSCRSVIGYALLDHFHADCWGTTGMMKIDSPTVEYQLLAVATISTTSAEIIPVQPGQFEQVFKHLLQRYQ